ncbi:hypothetical protein H310_04209 [Aphanomyces invadans]|uniref:Uncharacterized protein n=1 Tax=Aphanomyces invadans TaxID=157072 RepID=A0A024UG35_9STRA|nr:hypothetical protein H310_04209 [Aphanomyces invadans]ETW05239.1 hypothetical protein H310_04209 [Aphanomyces invadans]|eukprot:XP_008866677.1 hypothetical protein H310_04209 [Aphanomyces invadans]
MENGHEFLGRNDFSPHCDDALDAAGSHCRYRAVRVAVGIKNSHNDVHPSVNSSASSHHADSVVTEHDRFPDGSTEYNHPDNDTAATDTINITATIATYHHSPAESTTVGDCPVNRNIHRPHQQCDRTARGYHNGVDSSSE